jgi:RNase H-like domain found in reverse transcriptase/Chromo (CHRromatin Organisation MOdifier) domain
MPTMDHLAPPSDAPLTPVIFDPDLLLTNSLLNQLSAATATSTRDLCKPFVRSGAIITNDTKIMFTRGLLDTGAQGSNFVSRALYDQLPTSLTNLSRPTDRVVRLGDARSLTVQLEIPLIALFRDSFGNDHRHSLWYSVLSDLSHDLIIGLVDLIGPYYDLFEDSILASRTISLTRNLGLTLTSITDDVQSLSTLSANLPSCAIQQTTALIAAQQSTYLQCKRRICSSSTTSIKTLVLEDGSTSEVLTHPTYGVVFSDHRVESRLSSLTSLLTSPLPGQILPPWSQPLEQIAPEELETPDPTNFPDTIFVSLFSDRESILAQHRADLVTHVTPPMLAACPHIIDLLTSPLALHVFCPSTWPGINMPPIHLDTKPGLPEFLKPRARPVRPALFHDTKIEFDRMRSYFYEPSTSPIACPLVVAPKATAPFIRLCGDYRPINPFIAIPQEPIPHVQQSLTKAAGWKIFVDLDMTNSFHQIPLDLASSSLLSVATPWGLFRPKFLPEGVGPASGILQAIVRRIFAPFDAWTIVIFDNFLVLAHDYHDAYLKLQQILECCHTHRLVLKLKKSWIGTSVVTFFGYEVRPGSWCLSQSRKDSISAMIFPTNTKMMQSFLGAANFFHVHIPNYASWSADLYECTTSHFNWDPTTWTKDYNQLFTDFQLAIQSSVALHFPDYSLPWVIRSDSSDSAVGAVLFQIVTASDNTTSHQPIGFASHKYSGSAVNWDVYKKEAYALYYAVMQFSYYLRGKEFLIETDHRNLVWLESSQVPIVIRWRVLLQAYQFSIRHIPGKENTVADWLSRMYPLDPILSLATVTHPTTLELFNTVHGGRSLHHGAKRTYLSLCHRYPGHRIPLRVIQDLVAECPICQKDRLPLTPLPRASLVQTLSQHVRIIGIDHITVTPTDEDGYVGLLLIVEHDTKYPMAYRVRDYTALTAATQLFKHYCYYGSYDAIYSDPGSALLADTVRHLNQWLGTKHVVSLVGRHQSNGTEHTNALFLGHLRRLVHDERLIHCWSSDHVLPLINHALATTPNAELGGFTPAELKFGTTALARFNLPDTLPPGAPSSDLIHALNRNLQVVRSISTAYQLSMRRQRTAPTTLATQNTFQPGDYVLWNPKETPTSLRSSKLAPKLLGPYSVIRQTANDVECRHLATQKLQTFHTDRLSPFVGTPASAKTMSLLDQDLHLVSAILAHRGNPKPLSKLYFLVAWQNYPSSSNTWEPYSNVKHLSLLHQYLSNNNLSHLIPRLHRQ